jgi:hypothetical protein
MIRQRKGLIRTHKVISDYGLADYYKHYKSITSGTNAYLNHKKYGEILNDILVGISGAMATQMYDFKLPHNLGRIITRKYRPLIKYDENGDPFIKRPINWGATKALWVDYPELKKVQFVYHTNNHSNGYIFVIIYRKHGCMFRNRLYYTAQINRAIKRNISNQIFEGEFDSLVTKTK